MDLWNNSIGFRMGQCPGFEGMSSFLKVKIGRYIYIQIEHGKRITRKWLLRTELKN
jgi:hypothetical protein